MARHANITTVSTFMWSSDFYLLGIMVELFITHTFYFGKKKKQLASFARLTLPRQGKCLSAEEHSMGERSASDYLQLGRCCPWVPLHQTTTTEGPLGYFWGGPYFQCYTYIQSCRCTYICLRIDSIFNALDIFTGLKC